MYVVNLIAHRINIIVCGIIVVKFPTIENLDDIICNLICSQTRSSIDRKQMIGNRKDYNEVFESILNSFP